MNEPNRPRLRPLVIVCLVAATASIMAGQFASNPIPGWIQVLNPILAAGLLYGATLSRRFAMGLVALTYLFGSVAVGFVADNWDYAFYGWVQVANIIALVISPVIGKWLLVDRPSASRRVAAGLGAAIVFYFVSNVSVWALTPVAEALYPRTLSGLGECLVAGIPYAIRNVAVCVCYTLVFFSAPVFDLIVKRRADEQATAATDPASV